MVRCRRMVTLRIRRLPHATELPAPAYATAGAAGLDLFAAVAEDAPIVLSPGARATVPTGLCIEVPTGFEAQVRARSGRALREGLAMVNGPGTIDSDYRGEVAVLAINLGADEIVIRRGERIAQLVVAPVVRVDVLEVDELSDSKRGHGGFGSTGR